MNIRIITVTTTSLIQGWEIISYLGTVSSHVVAGTSVFTDIFAGLSDFFGGRSYSYQKQISNIHKEAIEILKEKAVVLGANCIVGLRIDHDEISGKGKSMFMVTATGTAVFAQKISKNHAQPQKENVLSADDLLSQLKKREIIELFKKNELHLTADVWDFIVENQIHEIYPVIFEILKNIYSPQHFVESSEELKRKSKEYFLSLPENISKKILYNAILNYDSLFPFIKDIIRDGNLLDLGYINKLLDSENFTIKKRALELLNYDKSYYTPSDLKQFINLYNKIKSIFTIRAKFIEEKSKLTSNIKKKWRCECGQKNDAKFEYCSSCQRDIYGFKKTECKPSEILNIIKAKSFILENKFSNIND